MIYPESLVFYILTKKGGAGSEKNKIFSEQKRSEGCDVSLLQTSGFIGNRNEIKKEMRSMK